MINIIIDTSVLRQDRGFLKPDVLLLKKLSQLGLIRIHIPWIVYKESVSQNYLEALEIIQKASKDIGSLNKKGLGKTEHYSLLVITAQLDEIKSLVNASVHKHWDDFIDESKIVLHEIKDEHGKKVMSSYFKGEPPFPKVKSRKDIPDAFIYEAILSIRESIGDVSFVCEDNNLREAISKIDGTAVYTTFSDFYASAEYSFVKIQYEKVAHYATELMSLDANLQKLEQFVHDDIESDLFTSGNQIIEHPNIPSDDNEGSIVGVEDISSIEIMKDQIQFIDGVFYVHVEVVGIIRLDYLLFKSNYYLTDFRYISIIDDWNSHYYLVEESFGLKFSLKYAITNHGLEDEDFELLTEPISIEELNVLKNKQFANRSSK